MAEGMTARRAGRRHGRLPSNAAGKSDALAKVLVATTAVSVSRGAELRV